MTDQSSFEMTRWPAEAERLAVEGLYDPSQEHDACGVGLVVSIVKAQTNELMDKRKIMSCAGSS